MTALSDFREWWKDLTREEYVVKIWFAKKIKEFKDGPTIIDYAPPKIMRMGTISKLTQTELTGTDLEGNPVSIKTEYPFNYNLKKIH